MRLLLHICCGPCALYPVERLRAAGLEVVGLFSNPNIHPAAEYLRRRDTLRQFQDTLGIDILYHDEDYDPQRWFRAVTGREDERCRHCHQLRLERTAEVARAGGFEAFSTSLLYSRRQKHELIAGLGRDIAAAQGPKFLYEDFRPGWHEGITRSKALGMYRQDYCGCLYSELERRQGQGLLGAKI